MTNLINNSIFQSIVKQITLIEMYQKILDKIDSLSTSVDKTKMIFEKQLGILEEKTKEE
jgi:uncharacterized protein YjaG (DUF416 family)